MDVYRSLSRLRSIPKRPWIWLKRSSRCAAKNSRERDVQAAEKATSAAVCNKTGVWRGKYMRGNPEVNECRVFTPKKG